MRGLTILLVSDDPARGVAALRLAATSAATGACTRLWFEAQAVALLRHPMDEAVACLLAMALDLGVAATLCQVGAADAGLSFSDLDPRLDAGGLTGMLAGLGDDRLVTI